MNQGLQKEIANVSLFSGVDPEALVKFFEDCQVDEFKNGDFICREGEYADDCSILLSGKAEVQLAQKGGKSVKTIVMDEGEVFGEIAVLSGNPRTANIVSSGNSRVLNLSRRRLFKIIDQFPQINEKLEAQYRERVLISHLHKIPILSSINESVLEELAEKLTLHSYRKGEVIFEQGDEADAFYFVRYGFIKVHEVSKDGKKRVLAYLKEGHYFGEMALMEAGGKRNASVTATNRVELIKISKDAFQELLQTYPKVKLKLERIAEKRKERTKQIAEDALLEGAISAAIDSGVIQANAVLVMDQSKCVHCNNCVKACAALHDGHSRLSRKGTKLTSFLLIPTSCRHCDDPTCMANCPTGAITRGADGEIFHQDFCIGCGGCAKGCPYGNITIVDFSEKKPSGFGKITNIFSHIFNKNKNEEKDADDGRFIFPGDRNMVERPAAERFAGDRDMFGRSSGGDGSKKKVSGKKAVKCDMCREYDFMGCVYNCPTGAARRVDPSEFFSNIATVG